MKRLAAFPLAMLLALVGIPGLSQAESPAPSVHWGALDYPDREATLAAGVTFNRFTEFDPEGKRFNAMRETMGFNMATLSWTQRWQKLDGWNTNLILGIGPTADQPTRFSQNDLVHNTFGIDRVPVGATREPTDFSIGGSVTKWSPLLWAQEVGFASVGFSSGSLYHEVYGRLGLRRVPLLPAGLDFLRASAMGRYGRLYSGAAFRDVAPQAYMAQGSLSVGNYRKSQEPDWELEVGLTLDSGLFVDLRGDALEQRFGTVAVRFPYGYFETWNDLINRKDNGPTFGATLMFDLLRIRDSL